MEQKLIDLRHSHIIYVSMYRAKGHALEKKGIKSLSAKDIILFFSKDVSRKLVGIPGVLLDELTAVK